MKLFLTVLLFALVGGVFAEKCNKCCDCARKKLDELADDGYMIMNKLLTKCNIPPNATESEYNGLMDKIGKAITDYRNIKGCNCAKLQPGISQATEIRDLIKAFTEHNEEDECISEQGSKSLARINEHLQFNC